MLDVAPHALTRHRPAKQKAQHVFGDIALDLARVHEVCGTNRRTFAMMVAAQMKGPVFWIVPDWAPERPHADGMQSYINPGRLTVLTPKRAEDILWTVEETLRSGAVPLVVADLPGLPALTPVRRLHLAAETGSVEGNFAPLGLILTPDKGGAPGVETRWQLNPRHEGPEERWQLDRLRARALPPKSWHVTPTPSGQHEWSGTVSPVAETAMGS